MDNEPIEKQINLENIMKELNSLKDKVNKNPIVNTKKKEISDVNKYINTFLEYSILKFKE